MKGGTRQIFKSRWKSPDEARDLLQGVFASELLRPSRTLWIVSPWISDLPTIDNRSGTFTGLDPRWTTRVIRLGEVLERLLELGSRLVIATRPLDQHEDLLGRLEDAQERMELAPETLMVHLVDDLHEKGVLGDDFYLSGSMNLTYNGVEILEEALRYETSAHLVAEARLSFGSRWGGLPGNAVDA